MKHLILLIPVISLLIISGCREQGGKKGGGEENLTTIKTLGLAYLEEFKHDEAEKEFRKFIKLAPGQKFGYANLGLTLLRSGRYEEAKAELLKAIEIDPQDPDTRLILATVYQMNDEAGKAITELKTSLGFAPGHVKTLYQITEMLAGKNDPESKKERLRYLLSLSENAPGNIVPLLSLAEFYVKEGMKDEALEQLENILQKFPEFPHEATAFYDKTMTLLRKGDIENALIQFTVFHNYMKVYSPYQAGMVDLKGPGGSLIGFPLIRFDQPDPVKSEISGEPGSVIFTDVTSLAGLDLKAFTGTTGNGNFIINVVRTADFDSDGDIDIYMAGYHPASLTSRQGLFRNDIGRFTDVASAAGLRSTEMIISASFADYDNDGFLDLYIVTDNGTILYKNADKELFKDVTKQSGTGGNVQTLKALFFDADHDGDLDIFETCDGKNRLLRNNADGTFTEQSGKSGVEGDQVKSSGAAFGDFDEDGDLDFIVINENARPVLYSNQRQGLFRDVTSKTLPGEVNSATALAVADYNNDGYLDIFIAGTNGTPLLLKNLMNGTFEAVNKNSGEFISMHTLKIRDAAFFDFDNDGFNDLLVAGELSGSGRGLLLFRNDGNGSFTDVSDIIPETVTSVSQIALFDYNDDGDLDILVAGNEKGVLLLRNDGGNNNHFIKMKLVGLRTGSAKNNFYGIGAKVEIRAGEHYSTTVVTDPFIHFGLGNRQRADIIRITWTNGVPQNIFQPGTDQALIEAQTLKGSCPFLYAWDGEKFVFLKDILWRSALGMPLGIMGETTEYAFPDASDDYIKIPTEQVKPLKGKYVMQVTSELWETIYTDLIELIAIDHPDSIDLFVPEQFTPPPFPGLKLYALKNKIIPVSAVDKYGNDMLPYITARDDIYTPGMKAGKYQGITEINELTLSPGEINVKDTLFIFLTGWIFPTDASINFSISQSGKTELIPPEVQVSGHDGEWITVDRPGFPMGKDKTVISFIPGHLISNGSKVRIVTNMDIHWDQIFFAGRVTGSPLKVSLLRPVSADLHYRGFSATYRKGGRYGPHWFDYYRVNTETKWRDLTGIYTRYGNVLPLLKEIDNQYIISNAGDEITVSFDVPEIASGNDHIKRTFFIRSVGWVKDGDMNTATGNRVEPLPFHGMKSYPYWDEKYYPADPDLKRYNRKYNTRKITDQPLVRGIKEYAYGK